MVERRSELVLAPLALSETIDVPPGDYDATSVRASFATGTRGTLSVTGEGNLGGFYGGRRDVRHGDRDPGTRRRP